MYEDAAFCNSFITCIIYLLLTSFLNNPKTLYTVYYCNTLVRNITFQFPFYPHKRFYSLLSLYIYTIGKNQNSMLPTTIFFLHSTITESSIHKNKFILWQLTTMSNLLALVDKFKKKHGIELRKHY